MYPSIHNKPEIVKEFEGRRFMVRVPTIATYTEDEIRILGLPMHYDETNDKATRADSDMSRVTIKLPRILEIYRNGYPISLVDSKEVPELYRILQEYLNYASDLHNFSVNVSDRSALDQQLKVIDDFLNEMFSHQKVALAKDVLDKPNALDSIDSASFMPMIDFNEQGNTPIVSSSALSEYNRNARAHNEAINNGHLVRHNKVTIDPSQLKRTSLRDTNKNISNIPGHSSYSLDDEF